ncbi:MAG TPA: glycosyltransferase [Humisphaera sp.]|jgi:glycosyltransferase involved in cell wall biosynthesis|nr:glycosyltransferase [Humisphaera sp.]
MKVLVSAAGVLDGRIGGGQIYVQKLAGELARRGHDVSVVAVEAFSESGGHDAWSVRWRDWRGIPVAGVSVNAAAARIRDHWTDRSPPLLSALRNVIDEIGPDLIHLNGLKPALTSIAVEREIPHLVTAHHAGVACPMGALLRPDDAICPRPLDERACAACYCRQLRGGSRRGRALAHLPPVVYRHVGQALNLLHNPTYAGRTLMYPWLVEQAVNAKRATIRAARQWIAPSRAIADVLIRNGAEPKRVAIVPHGVEPLDPAPLTGLGTRPVRFGYVGQINRPKGLHVLLEAFSSLPQNLARLELVGAPQGASEQEYFKLAMRQVVGRSDVVLRGAVDHEQIQNVMGGLDVLILPSIYLEVFGLVVLEAFSVGRPVIVTACGGPSEIVRDEIDGLVVPPNDVAALSAAMRHLAEHPDRIQQLAAGIGPVRTLADHVDELEGLYESALQGQGLQRRV